MWALDARKKRCQKRKIDITVDDIDLVGLVLQFLKSSARHYGLCPTFGHINTSVNSWLQFSMEVMFKVVKIKDRVEFEVKWPNESKMKASSENVRNITQEKNLSGVFAVVNVGRLPCAEYINLDTQNAYYDGYTANMEMYNLLVCNFFAEVIHGAINYPGSWHENKLAVASGLYYPKLCEEHTPPGFEILGDSKIYES